MNRIGQDGNDIDYAGDSVVHDFLGEPLAELGGESAVTTVELDGEALRAFRERFPAHLDADRFTLDLKARPMKKPTRVNHPPRVELAPDNHPVVAPIYQTVKFEFDSLDETMKNLRGERPGFFYTRASNPDHAAARADPRGAAGAGRLPGHGLGRRRHRAGAASR